MQYADKNTNSNTERTEIHYTSCVVRLLRFHIEIHSSKPISLLF